jgi:hypothetical protein
MALDGPPSARSPYFLFEFVDHSLRWQPGRPARSFGCGEYDGFHTATAVYHASLEPFFDATRRPPA